MTAYFKPHIPLVLSNDGDEGTFWIPWRNTVELLDDQKAIHEKEKQEMRAGQQELMKRHLELRRQFKVVTDEKEKLEMQLAQRQLDMHSVAHELSTATQLMIEYRFVMERIEEKLLEQRRSDTGAVVEAPEPIIIKTESLNKETK